MADQVDAKTIVAEFLRVLNPFANPDVTFPDTASSMLALSNIPPNTIKESLYQFLAEGDEATKIIAANQLLCRFTADERIFEAIQVMNSGLQHTSVELAELTCNLIRALPALPGELQQSIELLLDSKSELLKLKAYGLALQIPDLQALAATKLCDYLRTGDAFEQYEAAMSLSMNDVHAVEAIATLEQFVLTSGRQDELIQLTLSGFQVRSSTSKAATQFFSNIAFSAKYHDRTRLTACRAVALSAPKSTEVQLQLTTLFQSESELLIIGAAEALALMTLPFPEHSIDQLINSSTGVAGFAHP